MTWTLIMYTCFKFVLCAISPLCGALSDPHCSYSAHTCVDVRLLFFSLPVSFYILTGRKCPSQRQTSYSLSFWWCCFSHWAQFRSLLWCCHSNSESSFSYDCGQSKLFKFGWMKKIFISMHKNVLKVLKWAVKARVKKETTLVSSTFSWQPICPLDDRLRVPVQGSGASVEELHSIKVKFFESWDERF